jgi:hypothetical protein
VQLKLDLHLHTDSSPDGVSTLIEMARAARLRGLDGIAVTDHDHPLSQEEAESATAETGLLVIPGVEVSTSSGHLLVLVPHRSFNRGTPFMDVVRVAVEDGSLPIIPHPMDPLSHGVGEGVVMSSLPFHLPLEVLNASTLGRYNRRARKLAERLALSMVGGSDAHQVRSVGDAYTIVEAPQRSVHSVLEAIRVGATSACGHQTPLSTTLYVVWRRLARRGKSGSKQQS